MKINFYTSKFNNPNVSYGFFTRQGGKSIGNFSSLNCSLSSEDNKEIVNSNINLALKEIGFSNKKLKTLIQVHSNTVCFVDKKNFNHKFESDGLITLDKDICIAVLTADCCPIFIYDVEGSFIACVHSGWKGCFSNIIKNAAIKINKIQPNIKNIQAIVGPCLSKENFEVTEDFKNSFIKQNEDYKTFFSDSSIPYKYLFDMRKLIEFQLLKNNIANIHNVDLDTYANKNLFFSHRRSTHKKQLPTGRMINIIGFNK